MEQLSTVTTAGAVCVEILAAPVQEYRRTGDEDELRDGSEVLICSFGLLVEDRTPMEYGAQACSEGVVGLYVEDSARQCGELRDDSVVGDGRSVEDRTTV
jgi:hypothetical protein